jgi:arylsulfatase A-like enzyme
MKKLTYLLAFLPFIAFNTLAQNKTKPNVLFIAIDDLKPMLGCYGESHVHSPNIDKLALSGTVFLANYCQQAVCAPTRASLLTGQRPDYTQIWDLKTLIRDKVPNILTLPQYFRQQGYTTSGIGKVFDSRSVDKNADEASWSIPYLKLENNDFAKGFNKPFNSYYQSQELIRLIESFKEQGIKNGLKGKELVDFVENGRRPLYEAIDVPDDAYIDGANTLKAIQQIKKLKTEGNPFFMAVGLTKPHLPFVAPKKYWDLYERSSLKLAEFQALAARAPEFAFQASNELVNQYILPSGERMPTGYSPKSEELQRLLLHGYYASVSYTDAQVGLLLAALKEQGLDQNTIIVLWGDHGWHLGDHTMWAKHSNFEQATRAPLLFSAPGFKGGQKVKSISEFVDVFPTLAELAGLQIPKGLAGKSLVPAMKNPSFKVKEFAQSQYPRLNDQAMGYAIRTEQFRMVTWFKGEFHHTKIKSDNPVIGLELYDYKKDPLEKENLALKAEYAGILKQHQDILTQFLNTQNQSR